jgi:hypothetical protein
MWLADLRYILANKQLRPDYSRLWPMAEDTATAPSLGLALNLLQHLGDELPPGWSVPVLPSSLKTLSQTCMDTLTGIRVLPARGGLRSVFAEIDDEWRLMPNWRLRWVVFARLLQASDNDRAELNLAGGWSWLYVPLRPWLWLRRRFRQQKRKIKMTD